MKVDRFHLSNVVPKAMAEVQFSLASAWKNEITVSKQHTLILAPSGSGKTSLMGFLYGLRNDYNGTISLNDHDLRKQKLSWWSAVRQNNLSAVFQDLRLIPHLTVKENLLLKNNLTRFKSEAEIHAMVDQLGISEKWEKPCGTLSFGQQQRVSVIRSLLQPMDFLLADEPFSHMDDVNMEKARNLMLQVCNQQGTALVLFSLGQDFGIQFNQKFEL